MLPSSEANHSETSARGHRSQNGFTLTELLVVMSIIAILAFFILSGVQSSLGMADRSHCSSNLKRIVQLAILWGADNEEWSPQGAWFNSNLPAPYQNLTAYGLTNDLLKCPRSKLAVPNYGINSSLVTGGVSEWGESDVQYWAHGRFKFFQLSSQTILFAESASESWSPPENSGAFLVNQTCFSMPHSGQTAVAYVDGHIEFKTAADLAGGTVWTQGIPGL